MNSFELTVDRRELLYGRMASAVLATLRKAVGTRIEQGQSQKQIADRIGCDKSHISRILKGRTSNLTLRTISDILWACDHEPKAFEADAVETIARDQDAVATHLFLMPVQRDRTGRMTPCLGVLQVQSTVPSQEHYWSCSKGGNRT